MRLHALTAAGEHDLVQTGMWNLLRQRFYAVALEAPSAANAKGWTDLDAASVAEALGVLLSGSDVSRSVEDDGGQAWLATGVDGDATLVQFDADGAWQVFASGESETAVGERLSRIVQAFPVPDLAGQGAIAVRFWALGSMGPFSYQRRLDVTEWADGQANYPEAVRGQLDALMASGPPTSGGKLLLLHGVPGTGKTRVTESLADAWRSWCDVDFIVDADNFFGVAAYMVSTMIMGDDGDRWRLIVIEDSGEFLVADAKNRPTQGLSRLLNLSDGMVGQGLKLLVLMTTNEDVSELHPAVTRPGRCMANIGFGPFPETEAQAWLDAHDRDMVAEGEMSLAELYAT